MIGPVCVSGTSAQESSQLHEAKARLLSTAPGFVKWPAAAFKTASAPLEICVHGDSSFGTGLAELTRASALNGHRVEVKWARKEQDLPECQILFVSHSAAKRYDKTLDAVKNSITLTIGEDARHRKASRWKRQRVRLRFP